MAKIFRREWTSTGPLGKRVRHVAFGYTLAVNGTRERKVSSAWLSEQDALKALSDRQQELQARQIGRSPEVTLAVLAERYLTYKENTGKKSVKDDRRILTNRLFPDFGQTLQIRQLTEARIAQYEQKRVSEVSTYTVSNELGILRHLLRLARKWGYLDRIPDIEMPQKAEGPDAILVGRGNCPITQGLCQFTKSLLVRHRRPRDEHGHAKRRDSGPDMGAD